MWRNKNGITFLIVLSLLFLPFQVFAVDWQLPEDLTVSIVDGMTWHLGDYYIGTSGTDIHVETWMVNDWVTYTVDGSGSQTIYYGSEPSKVFIDEVKKDSYDGWSYSSGVTTITGATSKVSLFFGSSAPPSTPPSDPSIPQPSAKEVIFKVTVAGEPCEGCMIEVYELPYEDYRGVCFTDFKGSANMSLDFGEYRYVAEYEGMSKNDTFLHIEPETILIEFPKKPFTFKTNVWKLLIGVVVIAVAVLAINKIRTKR